MQDASRLDGPMCSSLVFEAFDLQPEVAEP